MQPLLTNQEMREVDRLAIQSTGLPELVLMEHAALALVDALKRRFGKTLDQTKGACLCGTGNNGGDVVAAARLLHQQGIKADVYLLGEESKLSKSAATQLHLFQKLGYGFHQQVHPETLQNCDWILDGVFGTGLSQPVADPLATLFTEINHWSGKKWIISADIPSGLSADTGLAQGISIQASETVCFGFLKRGLVTGDAADYVGALTLSAIAIPRELPLPIQTFLWDREDAQRIPLRKQASHKGTFGHVFVHLGEAEKEGAAIFCGLGALRSGAGLVTLVGDPVRLDAIRPRLPADCMTEPFKGPLLSEGVQVIGPGLGASEGAWKHLVAVLRGDSPVIVDADALTLLSEHLPEGCALLKERHQGKKLTVLTPHPKEAAKLLQSTIAQVQSDRYQSIEKLVHGFSAWIVLKGRGSLIRGVNSPTFVVNRGNSALAKGGTGDLLCGILASLIAQQIPPLQAIPFGVFLHGRAAEVLVQRAGNEWTPTVSDIAEGLRDVFYEILHP